MNKVFSLIFVSLMCAMVLGCGGGQPPSESTRHERVNERPPMDLTPFFRRNGEKLALNKVKISDSDLLQLKDPQFVGVVDVMFGKQSQITDSGLASLQHLPNLKSLRLTDTAVTDNGLKQVSKLDTLENLWLRNTAITDGGIRELAPLSQLRMLSIGGTSVSDVAKAHLKEKLPDLEIY